MKLIDSEKLISYLTDMKNKYPGPVGGALYVVLQQIEYGTFSPTPPVQPDIKPGDKVRHKDNKHFGIGIVDDIAKSGLRAFCYFPDYDRSRSNWEPRSYYRLDKLEVITDDQPTKEA
jgi:hypothetical protein